MVVKLALYQIPYVIASQPPEGRRTGTPPLVPKIFYRGGDTGSYNVAFSRLILLQVPPINPIKLVISGTTNWRLKLYKISIFGQKITRTE